MDHSQSSKRGREGEREVGEGAEEGEGEGGRGRGVKEVVERGGHRGERGRENK